MKEISLRAKLTLWYSALFAVTVIAFALAAQALRSRALLNQFDNELRDELRWAEILLSTIKVEALLTEGEVKAALVTKLRDDIAQHFMLNRSTHLLEIRAHSGQLIYRSVSPNDTLSQLFDTEARFDHPVTVAYGEDDFRVLQKQTPKYRINLAVSLRPLYDIQWQLARTFLWLVPLAMAVAVGGGWLLAKYSMRPVTRVIQAARQITATNLSQRLPTYPAQDEIGALVETVNDLIARIEQGVGRLEEFSQNVAHELRTPLTILRGEMELALAGNTGAPELRRIMASALEEISRAAKIVESLLFLAHVDSGKMEAKKERVALDLLAAEVFEDAQALAEGRPLHLALTAPEQVVVAGDASRLRRLLLNLVENAIKYTPEGKVEISVRRSNTQAIIIVSDTGIGIAPEHLEHIFERFYRIDPDRSRETGGSGLGLSICAAIAHAHGGEIRVESTVGKGSTFEVKLPLVENRKEV
ncbi:MAG: heavy metal sensor histidine kinase [candidate division KSB1 bacterium]|nr:heavy metal sensor histidine kinase [candidate division KSB1 bacterium]MDZ7309953.1 heavy metal sensor histidine kinase [candidate division KSB1 bacterium]